ncbi:hypothetical protein PAE9249_01823 [Paenibacillus sp. CECT 9249]|nr:hypothetical protein PAE9249_01823 [Paenibacillus sp. CECT 9249]
MTNEPAYKEELEGAGNSASFYMFFLKFSEKL